MKKIKTVVLANPCSESDPFFYTDEHGYLFPRVLQRLQSLGLSSSLVISVSDGVDEHLREIVSAWGLPCEVSHHALPQHRLNEVAACDNSEGYLLLTPYAYLLPEERLREAVRVFSENDVQCVDYEGTSSSSAFCICDRRAVRELTRYAEFAVTPFVAAKYLRDRVEEDPVLSLEMPDVAAVHGFLNKLLYYGDNGILPKAYILDYFGNTPEEQLFSEASYMDHLARLYRIDRFEDFTRSALEALRGRETEMLAAQVHLVKRLLPHLPENKDCFLELGFGRSPIASLLLLNVFGHGHAVEPYTMHSVDCDLVEFISNNIDIPGYIGLERTRDCGRALDNLSVHTSLIEECDIPPDSVDFIFSKTVFEHVMDVPGVSKSLYDILRPGGRMYHIVDFRDHVDTSTIRFDFLLHDKKSWAAMNKSTNLWRVNDMVDLWKGIGFEVEVVERLSRVQSVQGLHSCWEPYAPQDLFCYHAILVAEKPAVRSGWQLNT